MIWGMTLQPGYEYTEIVDDEVRLSMATLECRPRKAQGDTFQLSSHVVVKTIRGEFLLCNLEKGPTPQQSLDLVLQPREKVTFSVEGTGVVHLMGYTSELPEEHLDQEDPIDNVTELPPAEHHPEPSHPQEIEDMVQQQPLEEENEDVTVKSEPEAVVIPILEEALEEMEQAAKDEEGTTSGEMIEESLSATTPIQAINSKDPSGGTLPPDTYGYQQINQEEGWITQEQSRMRGIPTASAPGTETQPPFTGGPVRSMQSGVSPDMPSTSYTHVSPVHAGQSSRVPATRRPATTGAQRVSHLTTQAKRSGTSGPNPSLLHLLPSFDPKLLDPSPSTMSKKLNCSLCGTEFEDRDQLLHHESVHLGKKLHFCAHCGKAFKLSSNLRIHIRKHTGEKPYHCRFCAKGFASSSNCKIHERCHTGEKPFKCHFCEMSFKSSSNCRKHERRHTGEKPYVCQICKRAFANQRSLKKHLLRHTAALASISQTAMLVSNQSTSREVGS